MADVAKAKKRQIRWATKVRTGCVTCRKRKIKCDEGKPSCRRCISAGRKCTGLSFGDDSTARGWLLTARQEIARAPGSVVQFNSSEDMADLCRMIPLLQIRSSWAHYDVKEVSLILSASQRVYWYMDEMPCRAGREESLDAAVKCVAIALREYLSGSATESLDDTELGPRSLMSYIEALQTLRQSLADASRRYRAEVLCAAQLLGLFEIIVEYRKQAPAQHIFGVSHLIEHRGPTQFKTQFERGLLIAQIPAILSQSCFHCRHPFLVHPDWTSVLRSSIRHGADTIFSEMRLDMYDNFIVACALFADASKYLVAGIYGPSEHRSLLDRAVDVRQRLFAWYSRYTATDMTKQPKLVNSDLGECNQPLGAEQMVCLSDTYVMMIDRFYIALGGHGAVAVEEQAQHLAHDMLQKYVDGKQRHDANVLMGVSVAKAILDTVEDYESLAREAESAAAAGVPALSSPELHDKFTAKLGYPRPGQRA